MTEKDVLNLFKYRVIKENNNYLFTDVQDMGIIDKIPENCSLSFATTGIGIPYANNIKIDLQNTYVENILRDSMFLLNIRNFSDRQNIYEYEQALKVYKMINQLIIYNIENLTEHDQMLLNELYDYVTPYFNINVFTRDENLKTTSLYGSRSLNNYTSYNKVRIK